MALIDKIDLVLNKIKDIDEFKDIHSKLVNAKTLVENARNEHQSRLDDLEAIVDEFLALNDDLGVLDSDVEPEDQPNIVLNKIKCNHCEDEIESTHQHDYKECKCGKVMTDGGNAYLRRSGNPDYYTDLSLYDEGDNAKNNLRWGTRGKDGDQPLTYKKLIDCDSDHLVAILETQKNINLLYRKVITEILEDRNVTIPA